MPKTRASQEARSPRLHVAAGRAAVVPKETDHGVPEKRRRPIGRPKGTGSQHIYDVVRMRILALKMPPGSGIDENALVAEFGVSRTPVREALIRLATDGYVTIMPNRGASVRPLDIDEIPELLEAMEICLRVTSRWAALRRSDEDLAAMREHQRVLEEASRNDDYLAMSGANSGLHLSIALAAGNAPMTSLYRLLLPQYHRLTVTLLSSAPRWTDHYKNYFAEVYDEHERLIAAIEARDSELADRLAQDHARLIGERLEAYVWSAYSSPIPIYDPRTAPASGRNPTRREGRSAETASVGGRSGESEKRRL